MIIISKYRDVIINVNNICTIYINDDKNAIFAIKDSNVNILLGEYEDEEVIKTVFNQIIEAMEQCEEVFYMPE